MYHPPPRPRSEGCLRNSGHPCQWSHQGATSGDLRGSHNREIWLLDDQLHHNCRMERALPLYLFIASATGEMCQWSFFDFPGAWVLWIQCGSGFLSLPPLCSHVEEVVVEEGEIVHRPTRLTLVVCECVYKELVCRWSTQCLQDVF